MRSLLGSIVNKSPVPLAPRMYNRGSGRFTLSGRNERASQLRTMSAVGTVFAIVNRTAKGVSEPNWRLYRSAASGAVEDRVEVTSHAALDLWNRPNPFYTQSVFVESGMQHKLLVGETWWVIGYDERSTIPLELWPVRPDRMEPVPDPYKFLAGYMYNSPDGEQIALRIEDVVMIKTPNPDDPYRGLGPIQSIMADLESTRYSAEWNRNFFANSAEPGGIIEVDERLDDNHFNELQERWNEQHKGVANAHRVAVLEGGMKWSDRSYSQRDMQFVELRDVSREVVREAFGFPKSMLGTAEDVNRANAEAGEVLFARWLLTPELETIRDALNQTLLPLFGAAGRGLEFDFDNPVPDDRDLAAKELSARAASVRDLVAAGAYGPDAVAAVGLPEIAFGAPGADPNRELLIKLVTNAPTLAPMILPMLGFDVPPGFEAKSATVLTDAADFDAAQRWVAVAQKDRDVCDPCRDNDGKTYRNREDAYKDYPGGSNYVNCIGEQYGNDCRCKVVKRRQQD